MSEARAQAMLLAAGLGTRLWPLTEDRAKPAVPFLGRPLIEGLVALLARAGIRRAVVNTHHLPGSVRAALARAPELGVDITYSHEQEILGTAGALGQAYARGLLTADLPVLVVNAKLHTSIALSPVLDAHHASGAAVTMVLRENLKREAFREVRVEGQHVVGFGQGRQPESARPLLFTGIHVLAPEVVAKIPATFLDTVADVYPPLITARRVHAHLAPEGLWWELSTLERYLELHLEAHALGLGPSVTLSAGAVIEAGASVTDSVLWEDARVGAGAVVERAVLGKGARVPTGAAVKRAVLVPLASTRAGDRPPAARVVFDDQLLVPLWGP